MTPTSFRNVAKPSWETAAVTTKIWIGPPTGGGCAPGGRAMSSPGSAAICSTTSPVRPSACPNACGRGIETCAVTSPSLMPSGPSPVGGSARGAVVIGGSSRPLRSRTSVTSLSARAADVT